jgi:hypothetical protein
MALKRFNEFQNNDKFNNIEPMNEFFKMLKDIFKNAKDNLSLKISKQIGGAADVDKAIEEYQKKIDPLIQQQLDADKKLIEAQKGAQATGDDEAIKNVKAEVDKIKENTEKQKQAAKKTFNLKINDVISKSDDKNIKSYANLKRAEMAEEILARQLGQLQELGAEQVEDNDFKKWIEELEQKAMKSSKFAQKLFGKLKGNLANADKEVEYEEGDKIKYTMKDGTENEGEVMNQDDVEEGMIRLKTDKMPNGFAVSKDKIVGKVEDLEAGAKEQEAEQEEMADIGGEEK